MRLNLGENLYQCRKKADLTQKEFADRLGVSCQSVSRWENGTTYPDLELLPVISRIFHISIDELCGLPNEKKEQAAKEAFQKLAKAAAENPVDVETVKEQIQDIRRNHLESENFWHFWLSVKNNVYCMPEILPEVRLTVESLLESHADMEKKQEAIAYMAKIEDEAHIERFLKRYASERDLTKNALLSERYKVRGEWEKHEPLRQWSLFEHVDQMIGNESLWRNFHQTESVETLLWRNSLQLNLLHQLCADLQAVCDGLEGFHPISGNGEVDCWIDNRIWLGFQRAGYLVSIEDYETAYLILEDTVSLIEKAMQIIAPVELRCASPWLRDMVWTAEETWVVPEGSDLLTDKEERVIWIHKEEGNCYVLHPSWYQEVLASEDGQAWYCNWRSFDQLRGEERYQEYVKRLEQLVVYRPKESDISSACHK